MRSLVDPLGNCSSSFTQITAPERRRRQRHAQGRRVEDGVEHGTGARPHGSRPACARPRAASSCRSTMSSPPSQNAGSARSQSTMRPSSLGRLRPAGRQQLEVGGHERRAAAPRSGVHREGEQLAVGVGVHVAGRRDEVRDVAPPRAVAVGELDRVAEHRVCVSRPVARRSRRPTARRRSRRWVCTASSKRFIATWRNTVAIEPSRLSASSARRAAGSSRRRRAARPKVTVSPNTDAVSARVSGVRMWNTPCVAGEVGVQAVAELVGERQRRHARAAGPVEQQVRVVRRAPCRRRTRPGRLPGRTGASIHRSSKNRVRRRRPARARTDA